MNVKDMKDMEDLEKLFAKKVERIQSTISLFRKVVCVLAVIAAAFMFFYARKDYSDCPSVNHERVV